jgi:Predicted ornithine cyclodeaminase, mu-crystallin homolog
MNTHWEKIEGEIGNLILSNISGRLNDNDITIFNSIGSAIQDLVISSLVMEANLYEKK